MRLNLYNNTSPDNYINKNLTQIAALTGTLRQGTSLLYPSITIEIPTTHYVGIGYMDGGYHGVENTGYISDFLNDILTSNYAYIEEFKRYYFITNIFINNNKLLTIDLKFDSIMSFKADILKLNAFVLRNENTYNVNIKDDRVSFYYDKEIDEYVLPKGDYVNTVFNSEAEQGLPVNVLITVVNDKIMYSSGDAVPPVDSLPLVSYDKAGQALTYYTYICTPINLTRLAREILNDDTKAGYIISSIVYPFDLPKKNNTRYYIRLGSDYIDGLGAPEFYLPKHDIAQYVTIADFTIEGSSFLDYEPYTQYELWIPYLSWIPISADELLNNRIIVYYVIDYQSGRAQVNVYDTTHERIIYTSNCQLGVRVGISSTNAREVKDRNDSNNISLGIGLTASALSTIGGVATMNPMAVASGLLAAGKNITQYIQNQNTNYNRASGVVSSANANLYMCQDVKIRKTKLKPRGYDSNYFHLNGRPLNEYKALETLSGYTEVADVFVENIVNATTPELNEIDSILKSGIVLNQ